MFVDLNCPSKYSGFINFLIVEVDIVILLIPLLPQSQPSSLLSSVACQGAAYNGRLPLTALHSGHMKQSWIKLWTKSFIFNEMFMQLIDQ